MKSKFNRRDRYLLKFQDLDDEEIMLIFLFEEYSKEIIRAAYRIVRDMEAARDLTQELFANLWENRNKPSISDLISRELEEIKAYLIRSVINRSYNHLRSHPPGRFMPADDFKDIANFPQNAFNREKEMEYEEMEAFVQQAIKKLPPQCQTVFQLSRKKRMTHPQIAEELGISVKTVEKHISRAIKILEPLLRPLLKSIMFLPFLSNFR